MDMLLMRASLPPAPHFSVQALWQPLLWFHAGDGVSHGDGVVTKRAKPEREWQREVLQQGEGRYAEPARDAHWSVWRTWLRGTWPVILLLFTSFKK